MDSISKNWGGGAWGFGNGKGTGKWETENRECGMRNGEREMGNGKEQDRRK